ncbi:MAG: hypothetical protein R6X18_10505 [Chloroflexota bacterium]
MLARFSGQPVDLLSFGEVVNKLRIDGQTSLGVKQIPVAAIVGSVGRYEDFTRSFLPRLEADENRWARVAAAAPLVSDLPPIEVYKIDESYFVQDGNHRVSVALRQGVDYIDAYVTEVRTRVPLPDGARPDDLIIAAEYADFLAYTQLDRQRPGIDLRVSVPGQYVHLENHIEAHRFWLEKYDGLELSIEDAAERWYDEAYLPLVEAIREQGILLYFPGRKETDFFIWLSRHRAQLQNQLGTIVAPDLVVSRLAPRIAEPPPLKSSTVPRWRRRLTRLLVPERAISLPTHEWSDDRRMARYSANLFANIMWPVCLGRSSELPELDQVAQTLAVNISLEEEALLWVMAFLRHDPQLEPDIDQTAVLRQSILDRNQAVGLVTNIQIDAGDPVERTVELSYLADLIVLSRHFGADSPDESLPTAAVRAIVDQLALSGSTHRPILIAGSLGRQEILTRVLLIYETRNSSKESLFIAAYLAERQGLGLIVLPVGQNRSDESDMAYLSDYLAMHEVNTTILDRVQPVPETIAAHANHHECELLVVPAAILNQEQARTGEADRLASLLRYWPHAVLIAG